MQPYLRLLKIINQDGVIKRKERTGTGTKAVFGYQMRYNLADGLPILTTKKMFFRGILGELLWMVGGNRNIRPLLEQNIHIWDDNAFAFHLRKSGLADIKKGTNRWNEMQEEYLGRVLKDPAFAEANGDLGPVYGYLWRHWKGQGASEVDQLAEVIRLLRTNPDDRRMVISAWDPSIKEDVALPPCHILFQFFVGNGLLSCQMYQRSVDVFLGLPFNITSYSILTMMVAQVTGYEPGELILDLGDTHIYLDHLEQVREQLKRKPKNLPTLVIDKSVTRIDDFRPSHFVLEGYDPYPAIHADMSV